MFGEDFQPNFDEFPLNLEGLNLPPDWKETKWKHMISLRLATGDIHVVSLGKLIAFYKAFSGVRGTLANIQSVNEANGRQMFFGLNPESKPGNEFSGWLYRERAGGGTTIVAYVIAPDGQVYIALLYQLRPLLFQGGEVIQVIGGYPVKMLGSTDEIHAATFGEELNELAKFKVVPGKIQEVGARYNTNKAMVITGPNEGISVQLVEIPYQVVKPSGIRTLRLNRDLIDIDTDRILEGISKETFFKLDNDLLEEVTRPTSGASSCIHTETAVKRAFDILIRRLNY